MKLEEELEGGICGTLKGRKGHMSLHACMGLKIHGIEGGLQIVAPNLTGLLAVLFSSESHSARARSG